MPVFLRFGLPDARDASEEEYTTYLYPSNESDKILPPVDFVELVPLLSYLNFCTAVKIFLSAIGLKRVSDYTPVISGESDETYSL